MHGPRAHGLDAAAPVIHKRPFDRANQIVDGLPAGIGHAALGEKRKGDLPAGQRPSSGPHDLSGEPEQRTVLEPGVRLALLDGHRADIDARFQHADDGLDALDIAAQALRLTALFEHLAG